jgi:hypothetical protein
MEILKVKEIKKQYGKAGFFSAAKNNLFQANYFGGDEFLDNCKKDGIKSTVFEVLEQNKLEINVGSMKESLVIDFSEINYIVVEKQEAIFKKKDKSLLGRALVGGLVLGPVGAIVGGMSSLKDSETRDKTIPDYLISINVSTAESDKLIIFSTEEKSITIVQEYLDKHFAIKLKDPQEVTISESKEFASDLTNRLLELKEMHQKGILTDDEFRLAKAKVINE